MAPPRAAVPLRGALFPSFFFFFPSSFFLPSSSENPPSSFFFLLRSSFCSFFISAFKPRHGTTSRGSTPPGALFPSFSVSFPLRSFFLFLEKSSFFFFLLFCFYLLSVLSSPLPSSFFRLPFFLPFSGPRPYSLRSGFSARSFLGCALLPLLGLPPGHLLLLAREANRC
jgi:hypothetical protein